VVIATLRSGEPVPDTVTDLWKDGHLRRLDLQPLSRSQCDALLATVLGGRVAANCAARMWELTHGNVLFLHQLVRQELDAGRLARDREDCWQWSGSVTVSSTLADLVEAYIGAAPEPVLEVLDLLAVAEPLELGYLTALADPAAIEDAERRELIRLGHDGPTDTARVGHPLYGEARRARMGRMRSNRLRGRIASAMGEPDTGLPPPDPVRLGLLWMESDLQPDARVLYRAAAVAFRRSDVALSERLSEAAARAGAGVESQVLQARTLAMLGRAGDAELLLASIPDESATDTLWAEAKILRGLSLLLTQGQPEQSWAVIDEALAAAPDTVVQELLAFRGLQLAMAGRPTEVMALAESIDTDRLDPRSRVNLNFGVTIALGDLGRPQPATQAPEDDIVLAAGSPVAVYQALALALIHADTLVCNGCIDDAVSVGERIAVQWSDLPKVPRSIVTAINGVVALGCGDLDRARSLLDAALVGEELRVGAGGRPYLGVRYWIRVAYTEALGRAGQTEPARESLVRMQEKRHPAYLFFEPNRQLAEAWVAAARGRTSEAISLAVQAAELARRNGQLAREALCLQAALQFGDNRNGDRLEELAGQVEGPRAAIVARWARAHARRDGDALLEVSRNLESMGDRIAAADAAAHAALAFGHHNLRGARLTASGRASQLVAACGATTPATREASAPLPLTTREREIAALVRDGLSNKEIAEELTTSVRTVEGHIYRACSKLGVANRSELAELIRQFMPSGSSAR
jgi:DNA-binding CsgD family transcriptional regulator